MKAYLFDVDGVITDPTEKKVTEPEILDEIVKRLELGEPVALNTGRSTSWMKERVIYPMIKRIKDKSILANFIAVGEKGGTWIDFDENGEMEHGRDDSISTPQSLQEKIRSLIDTKYPEDMFYDDSKETMISTEMKDGHDVKRFTELQKDLEEDMKKTLAEEGLSLHEFEIDPTTIATDIQNKHVGKDFGARRIIDWVKARKVTPDVFVALGDSRSDHAMAVELRNQGLPVDFVYVGTGKIQEEPGINYKYTQSHFSAGALEYLKSST